MKVVIAGSTGFVGAQLVQQAVAHRAVSSVVALSRRETPVPPGAAASSSSSASKFKSVVCADFEEYSEEVKKELAGTDACIWTIAVTPAQLWSNPWEQACKISRDYAVTGIKTMAQLPRPDAGKPLRFIYVSGDSTVRDPADKPFVLGEYCVMRGEAESLILEYAKQSAGRVEASIAKPGLIQGAGSKSGTLLRIAQTISCALIGLPKIQVDELSAALLSQAINGFQSDTLPNQDLTRIGSEAVKEAP